MFTPLVLPGRLHMAASVFNAANVRGLIKGSFATDPDFWSMSKRGIKITPMKGGIHQVAATIANLGEEGWEMVGCGNVSEGAHAIYFRRPLEE